MQTMPISEFKARALEVLKQVHRSGEGLVVTLRGRPLVRVEPTGEEAPARPTLGTGRAWTQARVDDAELLADDATGEWEMER